MRSKPPFKPLALLGLGIIALCAHLYYRNVEPDSVVSVCARIGTGRATLRLRTHEEGRRVRVDDNNPDYLREYELDDRTGWSGRCENGQPVGQWTLMGRDNYILTKKAPENGELRVFEGANALVALPD